jgi:hypothetical protein
VISSARGLVSEQVPEKIAASGAVDGFARVSSLSELAVENQNE